MTRSLERIRDTAMWITVGLSIVVLLSLLLRQWTLFAITMGALIASIAVLLTCLIIERVREYKREKEIIERIP